MSFLPRQIFLFFLLITFLLLALQIFLPGQNGHFKYVGSISRSFCICIFQPKRVLVRGHAVAAHKVRSNFETGDPTHTRGGIPYTFLWFILNGARCESHDKKKCGVISDQGTEFDRVILTFKEFCVNVCWGLTWVFDFEHHTYRGYTTYIIYIIHHILNVIRAHTKTKYSISTALQLWTCMSVCISSPRLQQWMYQCL